MGTAPPPAVVDGFTYG